MNFNNFIEWNSIGETELCEVVTLWFYTRPRGWEPGMMKVKTQGSKPAE